MHTTLLKSPISLSECQYVLYFLIFVYFRIISFNNLLEIDRITSSLFYFFLKRSLRPCSSSNLGGQQYYFPEIGNQGKSKSLHFLLFSLGINRRQKTGYQATFSRDTWSVQNFDHVEHLHLRQYVVNVQPVEKRGEFVSWQRSYG